MSDFPGVSCFCSTYGRPRPLIENSIWCFLEQDYPGPKELVILNDYADQRYHFEHPEVRIINLDERIKPLGRKFNLNVRFCKYDLIAVWEDDDIFLRHRLSYSVARLKQGVFHSSDAFIERQPYELEITRNYFHSQHLFTRELFERVGGYNEDDRCTIDVSIMERFRNEVGTYTQPIENPEELFYVYVWSGANSFHGSGMGIDNNQISDAAAKIVERQVKEGVVETGDILLSPKPRYPIYDCLPTAKSLHHPRNVRVSYGLSESRTVDVTSRIARLCATALPPGRWSLPADDVTRARIFGDPCPNLVKKVYVMGLNESRELTSFEIKNNESNEFSFFNGILALASTDATASAFAKLRIGYENACGLPSDINQHIPLLLGYARQCLSIVECGVRAVCSSYAFALALSGKSNNEYTLIDPRKSGGVEDFLRLCQAADVNARFIHASDLDCPLTTADLLFIDTWHVYAQLKRELARWHSSVRKYIILHDTTIDGIRGESLRNGWNIEKQSVDTGFPAEEISRGLWPAIEEFLDATPDWVLDLKLENNNGLTILRRRDSVMPSAQ